LNTKEEVNRRIERKSLSKKIRFEVFKRDMFKCQYCGRSPIKDQDVVLEVDHIVPVAEGGSNDMLNLVTSCWDCNRGKGVRKLEDRQVIVTQHEEIEKLQMENEQFDYLMEYKKEIMNVEVKKLEVIRLTLDDKLSVLDRSVSDKYLNTTIKKLVRKYGVPKILEVIEEVYDDSIGKYDKITDVEKVCTRFFSLIENYFNSKEEDPIKRKISYIFGIARNTFHYINQKQFYIITNELVKQGKIIFSDDQESFMDYLVEIEESLKDGTIRNWTGLKEFIGETSEDIELNLIERKNREQLNLIQDIVNEKIEKNKVIEIIGNLRFENELELICGKLTKFEYIDNSIKLYIKNLIIGIYGEPKQEVTVITLNWRLHNIEIQKQILDSECTYEIRLLGGVKRNQDLAIIFQN